MYLSKRQQEVLSMMATAEASEATRHAEKIKNGDKAPLPNASLWSMHGAFTLYLTDPRLGSTLNHVGFRTAYVLEGLGLIATCVDYTDQTIGYRLTERGATLVELLSDGCGFTAAS